MSDEARLWRLAVLIALAITAIRIVVLIVSPLELYPDEAQYWWWAQTPDFGYFSKPPLIAWIVSATTWVFGNAEWAIRLASPLLHAGTALMLFGIGRLTYNARIGFCSTLAYLTLPGVSYSAGLISTDAPLLFCWALAFFALLRAMDETGWRWTLLCGTAFGVGLLAKYAMLYFVLGAVVASISVPKLRAFAFGKRGLAVLALGLLILSPNIWWNWAHGFPTVTHTESNADWGHAHYSVAGALEFLGGQFGVFGPLMMAGLLTALWRLARRRDTQTAFLLAAFAVPVVLLIAVQGFVSEANANWAAVAYVTATPLAVPVLLGWRRWPLWASLALNGLVMAVLWAILVAPPVANALGLGNAFKRQEGWRAMGQAVEAQAARAPYTAVVAANRSVIAELLYYGSAMKTPVRMWDRDNRIEDHFEMTMRLAPAPGRYLLVLDLGEPSFVPRTFAAATRIGEVQVAVGGHRSRTTALYDARDYLGPQYKR